MTNTYLKTLYQDFSNKINSIRKYEEYLKNGLGEINQSALQWVGKLKEKYEILANFQKSRKRAVPSSNFAIEYPPDAGTTTDNEDIQRVDGEINDLAEQINHLFKKAETQLNFLSQSYAGLQDLVNSVNDQYQNSFDKM